MTNLHLILGGARSGKSRFAENLVQHLAQKISNTTVPHYLATATADDHEMTERIAKHKSQRGDHWRLIEEPIELANTIIDQDKNCIILVDCLTLWLSNCLHKNCWSEQKKALLTALEKSNATAVMVSNEVGSGITPMGELSREFVDESGRLHQEIAQLAQTVNLIVAGLPLKLK